jgi:hypothetical protein
VDIEMDHSERAWQADHCEGISSKPSQFSAPADQSNGTSTQFHGVDFRKLMNNEKAAAVLEYVLVASLISVIAITAMAIVATG